jgi:hypothetical protein
MGNEPYVSLGEVDEKKATGNCPKIKACRSSFNVSESQQTAAHERHR